MAARTLAELAKRTVINTLFFRDEPASGLSAAESDCSSSWEDQDDSTHVKPPSASSFTVSLTVDDGRSWRPMGPSSSPAVVVSALSSAKSSSSSNDALDGNLSTRAYGDAFFKVDSKRSSSFGEPRWTDEYTVKENDTLVSIAANFDIIPTMLKKINRLTVNYVYPGQILRVPPGPAKASSQCQSTVSAASCSMSLSEQAVAGAASPKPLLDGGDQLLGTGAGSGSDLRGGTRMTSAAEPDTSRTTADACQFVKLNAKYITECDGTVSGTLLVTPNAIMFDPHLSDRFVIEYGAELYGVMVPVDMVMSAAIYQDAEAMMYEREHKDNPTIPKPDVYHGEAVTENSVACALGKTVSSASRDKLPLSASAAEAGPPGSNSMPSLPLGPKDRGTTALRDTGCDEAQLTMTSDTDGNRLIHMLLSSIDGQPVLPTTQQWAAKPQVTTGAARIGSCEGDQLDDVLFGLTAEVECDGEDLAPKDSVLISVTAAPSAAQVIRPSGVSATALIHAADADLSEDVERHGLPIPKALPRRHSGPWPSDISAAASAASFFTPPGLQTFVDYASGLFASSDSKANSLQTGALASEKLALHSSEAAPEPHLDPSAEPHQLHPSPSAGSRSCRFKSEVCDKSDIFQVVDELLVKQTDGKLGSVKPLYLCLKVGVPLNKGPVHASHPIESYNQQQKPVYWFSIPIDKAPALYAFFVQWTADVYDAGDFDPAERGFVAISEESPSVRAETFCIGHPKHNRKLVRQLTKDWEIISISELRTRQTLSESENNLPLPTMDTQSTIMTDDHLRELVEALPLRLDGCPLHLVFGTEQHGFSLSKMYRNMHDIDSPILLLIQDTDDHVFGAFLSTPFNIQEHFCGTGESFLFTFVGGFKAYSWTGENSLFCRGCVENLWIGSGDGTFGLYLDGDIYKGRTQHCKTYNNDPLTGGPEEFVVNRMEAWYFFD